MNIRNVINVVGALTVVIGLAILTAVPVSYWMGDSRTVIVLLALSACIPIIIGTLM
jgi:high-affinity K+ transport system ATPase subunit B